MTDDSPASDLLRNESLDLTGEGEGGSVPEKGHWGGLTASEAARKRWEGRNQSQPSFEDKVRKAFSSLTQAEVTAAVRQALSSATGMAALTRLLVAVGDSTPDQGGEVSADAVAALRDLIAAQQGGSAGPPANTDS